jgi:hypothetical protein
MARRKPRGPDPGTIPGPTLAGRHETGSISGRIADSFYIDLSLLALINGAMANGTAPDLSGWRRAVYQR